MMIILMMIMKKIANCRPVASPPVKYLMSYIVCSKLSLRCVLHYHEQRV